jgi:hypothetical protein
MIIKNNVLQAADLGGWDETQTNWTHRLLVAGVFLYDGIRHSSRAVVRVGEQVGHAGHVGEIYEESGTLWYRKYNNQEMPVRIDSIYDAVNL